MGWPGGVAPTLGASARPGGKARLWIPWSAQIPKNTGWQDPHNTPRAQVGILQDPNEHPEKADLVMANVQGAPVFFVGGGAMWTEDLKDLVERYREEEQKYASQAADNQKRRLEAFRTAVREHAEEKLKRFKRNHRTMPDPQHGISKQRRVF